MWNKNIVSICGGPRPVGKVVVVLKLLRNQKELPVEGSVTPVISR